MIDFSENWFFDLDAALRAAGLDSDEQSFDEILENLRARKIYNADAFASHCAYVILAGGFSQQTAKKIHKKIMNFLYVSGTDFGSLIKIFNNKNKINAICKIWANRNALRDGYYALETLDDKLNYLQKLPHIGKITANHLARNLGEDVVKYDIWIQRLGCVFANKNLPVDNGNLSSEIKSACDDMFAHLVEQTGLPRGYIDVVLWKSLQQGLIKL
ncbi:MAG: hypothetical protein IJX89_04545 [Alphaproteobacteria bacterium]|nr:hypothetical protein [Alphaproteobacteria bacterium]